MSNQRASFRVDYSLEGQLHYLGQQYWCRVLDLSAGGARVEVNTNLPNLHPGRLCKVRIPMKGDLRAALNTDTFDLHLEILHIQPKPPDLMILRTKSIERADTPEHEKANKLVFALQRIQRAESKGRLTSGQIRSTKESTATARSSRQSPAKHFKRPSWVDVFRKKR